MDGHRSNRQAIFVMCAGVFVLVLNDATAKWLVTRYTPFQILFVRSLLALPVIAALVLTLDGKQALKSARLSIYALRGLLGVAAAYAFILSLSRLPLAEATALFSAAPIFVAALSALLLRDYVGWRRWAAVIAGFAGVLIIVRPGAATYQVASLLSVAAALLYALVMISARWIDHRDSFRTMMFFITLFPALFCAFVVFTAWPAPQLADIPLFIGMAIFGPLGVTLISQAFRMAPAAIVAPFDYMALVWASLLGWLIWGGVPDVWTYAGAAVIVASGVFVISRGSQEPTESV